MQVSLAGCEKALLQEIANPKITRRSVAQTYALALRSVEYENDEIDWRKVNRAILDRWAPSSLEWIKRQAWSGKAFNMRLGSPTDLTD